MANSIAMPTLSELRVWNTEQLNDAAAVWNSTADRWEDTFTRVADEVMKLGDSLWLGDAADAAQLRANADLVKVRGVTDDLRAAAAVAKRGAQDLDMARHAALSAVEVARASGYVVNEDLSVSAGQVGGPPAAQAARHAQAQAFAAEIRTRAAALTAVDQEIACSMLASTAGFADAAFEEGSVGDTPADTNGEKPRIQLVDHEFSQGPAPDPGPGGDPAPSPIPTAQSIQEAISGLPRGSKTNILLIQDPVQLQQLEQWVRKHSVEYISGTPYRGGQGVQRQLPDGTVVRLGPSGTFGPTADITIPEDQIVLPSGDTIKIHVDGEKGGVSRFPQGAIEELGPVEPAPSSPPRGATPPRVPPPELGGPPLGRVPRGTPGLGSVGPPSSGGIMRPFPELPPL